MHQPASLLTEESHPVKSLSSMRVASLLIVWLTLVGIAANGQDAVPMEILNRTFLD